MRKCRLASSCAFLAVASLLSACSGTNADTEASSTSNTPLSASGQGMTHGKGIQGKPDAGRRDGVHDDSDEQGDDEHERADGGRRGDDADDNSDEQREDEHERADGGRRGDDSDEHEGDEHERADGGEHEREGH